MCTLSENFFPVNMRKEMEKNGTVHNINNGIKLNEIENKLATHRRVLVACDYVTSLSHLSSLAEVRSVR